MQIIKQAFNIKKITKKQTITKFNHVILSWICRMNILLAPGDNRLGSMETGTALVRAMTRIMSQQELQDGDGWDGHIDVINMSYGEHAHWSNSG